MSLLFSELDQNISSTGNIMAEQQTLKLALELSLLTSIESLNGGDYNVNMLTHPQQHPSSLGSPNGFNPLQMLPLDDRSKKSQNMTECVPVPSSEHVAEIVGRQGRQEDHGHI
ncbi:RNA-binding protein MEX3D [Pseudolycoriella hygida]|uniref:RNA-binding protein MEX3D n=1 Tax=Pseudolycoriella hygida TaxID=35572 RepID=A0A9Q0N6I3_9DIPT|nr:RNA-binding protein MEX3D [Pseudolycoriella hygida]